MFATHGTCLIQALRNDAKNSLVRNNPSGNQSTPSRRRAANKAFRHMWILLLLPFVGLLWVPFYNFVDPTLFGFPFFYWYQLAWVPITSLLIWLVYRSRPHDDEAEETSKVASK